MALENEFQIIFGADTAPLRSEVAKASESVEQFGEDVKKAAGQSTKGFEELRKSIKGIPEAFDKVAGGSVVLSRIAGNLETAGKAAVDSSKAFKTLEGAPLQTIEKLDAAIRVVKTTLANGFKANLDTTGLSPQVFAGVSQQAQKLQGEVLELATALNQAVIGAKSLGGAFEKEFTSGITEELQRAGVSVDEFKSALQSLTGVGGANLAPFIQVLDSIQAESTGTTTAIKSIGGALQGVSVLAKAPINDLVKLDEELRVIKATLASGFKPTIEKINLQPADFSGVQTEINQANQSVENFGQTVRKTAADSIQSIDGLKSAAAAIPAAFDKAENSATGLDKIGQTIERAGEAAQRGAKDFATLGRVPLGDLKKLDAELRTIRNTLASGFKPALDSIKLIPANFSKATQAANQFGAATGKLKSNSNAAALALTDVSRVAQDLPFGFIGIANNINPMIDSFARLKKETGSTGGALKALAGSLTGAGGLGLAVAVVTAAFTIYQNGILGFNRKTRDAEDQFKSFLDSLRDAKTITAEATGSIEGEIIKVRTLSGVIQDVNASTQDRKRALEELKQVNKSYFGDLTLESAALGTLTQATDQYTKALVNQAIAKGFADELTKISVELRKQEGVLTKLEGEYKAVGRVQDDQIVKAAQFGASLQQSQEILRKGRAEDSFIKQRNLVEDLRGEMVALKSDYQDALTEGLKFKDLNTSDTTSNKEDARLKALKQELDGLQKQLEKINKLREAGVLPKFREDNAEALSKNILDVLNKIDAREVEIKLKPKLEIDAELNELEIDKIEAEANRRLAFTKMQAPLSLIIDTKGAAISKLQASSNEALRQAGLTEYKIPSVEIGEIKIPAGGVQIAGSVDAIAKSAQEKLKQSLEASKENFRISIAASSVGVSDSDFKTILDDFKRLGLAAGDSFNKATAEILGRNIAKTLADGVDAAFVNIGTAIAEVFNGGGLAAAAESFLSLIGSVMQEVGKQIIVASTLVRALKESLKLLFATPEVPLGIGIALVALGGILKNIKLDKPRKFADGGLVLGPTFAQLGEAGPEMVIPLNRANQFMDGMGGGSGFVAETALRGRDVILMIRRELASQGRTGGMNF